MSDSDRRHNCFGIVVRVLLTVVLFTVAMTLVWVRSSRTTAKGSVHYATGDVGPVARGHGLMLGSNATHVEQERVGNATRAAIQVLAEEQALRHRSRAEYSSVTTRYSNDGVIFQDNRFKTELSMSRNRAPMFDIQGKLIKKISHSIYHRHGGNKSTVVNEHLNNETDTSRQVLHDMNIRLNHRQINNYGYPTVQIDETVADTDVLNNNQNAYDLTYDMNEKGSEENKNSIDRSGWTTSFNSSGQIIPRGLWLFETPEISGGSDQPHFRLGTNYDNEKDMEYRFKLYDANSNPEIPEGQLFKHNPPTYKIDFNTQPIIDAQQDSLTLQPPESVPAVQNNMSSLPQPTMKEVPIINELLWRRIGIMALIKLGLVKLKVIGFIKILFFLLFKFKFFLIVLFLKFFSLLKFIKFSSLSFLFLPLAAVIFLTDIYNNSGIFSATNTPIPKYNEEVMKSLNGMIQFIEEIISTPGETTYVPTGQIETVVVPSGQTETVVVPSGQIETVVVPSGQTETVVVPSGQIETVVVPSGQSQLIPNSNAPPGVINAFKNLGLQYEPLEVMDPTLDLFQMELNSEKCVERIACKIAATGKTGIIPLWINWVLHRVSKPVPNDKLLYYLKAYDDVTNEIRMKSPDPDNWETWCFERYDCNNTDTK